MCVGIRRLYTKVKMRGTADRPFSFQICFHERKKITDISIGRHGWRETAGTPGSLPKGYKHKPVAGNMKAVSDRLSEEIHVLV